MSYPESAACASRPFLFFGRDGETGIERASRETAAKAICRMCPVHNDCLADALAGSEVWGVWGGTGEKERQRHLGRLRAGAVSA